MPTSTKITPPNQKTELVLVEVPVGKKEYALDTVICEEALEFGQEHIDETCYN